MAQKMCHSKPSSAAHGKLGTRTGIEYRYPLTLVKKWSWVVFVMVLAALPLLSAANQDFENLRASVESHGQSLRNMEHYLRKTNRFWNWYQANHKRLNELLADGPTTRALETTASQSILLQLEKKIDSMQIRFEEKLEAQAGEMKSLRQTLEEEREARALVEVSFNDRIESQSRFTSELQQQLLRQEQMLQECQSSVKRFEEEQVGLNRSTSNIVMFVKNLAAEANRSVEALHAEVQELRDAQYHSPAEHLEILNDTVQLQKAEIQQLQQASDRHTADIRSIIRSRNTMRSKLQGAAMKTEVNKRLASVERKINSVSRKVTNPTSQGTSPQVESQLIKLHTDVARLDGVLNNLSPLREQFSGMSRRFDSLMTSDTDLRNQVSLLRGRIRTLETNSGNMNLENAAFKEQLDERVSDLETRMEERHSVRVQGDEILNRVSNPAQPSFLNDRPGVSGSVDYLRNRSPSYAGSPGAPGDAGYPGTPGFRGSVGSPGRPGDAGSRGSTGLAGPSGPPGDSGSPGVPGFIGYAGSPGGPGDAGSRGAPGRPGYIGSSGSPGAPGDYGRSGMPGDRGAPGTPGGPGAPGAPGLPGDYGIRGNSGARGAPGAPGLRGPPGPAG